MGPYYLTTLVQLLGPARRGERFGAYFPAAATDSLGAAPRRRSSTWRCRRTWERWWSSRPGPIASLVTSFDVQATRYFNVEVYGTDATLSVPNPNTFGGPVRLKRNGDEAWTDVDLLPANLPQQRGIGLADMLWAQRSGRAHRTSSALALHVLELMTGALVAAEQGKRVRSRDDMCAIGTVAARSGSEYVRRLMETLRYGIVGSGFVAQFHLRALESVRGVEVAGLTSRTPPHALAESARVTRSGRGAGVRERRGDGAGGRRRGDLQRQPLPGRGHGRDRGRSRTRRDAARADLREAARPQRR